MKNTRTGRVIRSFGSVNTARLGKYAIYNIINPSSDGLTFTKSDSDTLRSRMLERFHKKLIHELLPSWLELLRGKDKYNLDDDKKITKAISNCMQTMKLNGSVVLMTPPDIRSKGLLGGVVERKTLVVHSDKSNCQAFCFFADKRYDTYLQIEEIKQGIFKYTDKDLSGHIILATKNILQQDLEKALKNDSVFSNDLGEFTPKTSDIRKEINKYQQNIIKQVFPENDGSGPKEGKAILMIPLQHSYYKLKIKNYSF